MYIRIFSPHFLSLLLGLHPTQAIARLVNVHQTLSAIPFQLAEVALLLVEGKGSEKKEQSDSKGPEPTVPGPKIHGMSRNSVVCGLGFPHFWMSVEDMPQIHRCFSFGCSSGSWQKPD